MSSEKLSLRLVIDTKRNKVLYAEAGKDVVDFLFSLVAMPVGTVVKLLNENNIDGITSGIAKIYQSIEHLDEKYFRHDQLKKSLLDPVIISRVSIKSFFLPKFVSCFYRCIHKSDQWNHVYYTDYGAKCPSCKNIMKIDFTISEGGGIVRRSTTYMIADDLTVTPMATISIFVILNRFNINDPGILEQKNIDLNVEKGLELLKASLQSNTVLTDVFL